MQAPCQTQEGQQRVSEIMQWIEYFFRPCLGREGLQRRIGTKTFAQNPAESTEKMPEVTRPCNLRSSGKKEAISFPHQLWEVKS